jgi:hypothetical protein
MILCTSTVQMTLLTEADICHSFVYKHQTNPVTGPVVAQRGVEVYLYSSKTLALEGGEWSAAHPHTRAALYPQERLGTHCTGGWVGPMASLDVRKISPLPGFEPQTVQPVVSRYTD